MLVISWWWITSNFTFLYFSLFSIINRHSFNIQKKDYLKWHYYLILSYRPHQPQTIFIKNSGTQSVSIYLVPCLACSCWYLPLPWPGLDMWFWFKRRTFLIITTVHPWYRSPYKAHHCWSSSCQMAWKGPSHGWGLDSKASSSWNSVRNALASHPLKSSNMPLRLPVRSGIKLTPMSSPNFIVYVGKHWNKLYC